MVYLVYVYAFSCQILKILREISKRYLFRGKGGGSGFFSALQNPLDSQ